MKILLTIMALMLAGCSISPMLPLKPYKIDIQQGNFVTQEMLDKLKPGMTRSQVRFALGTPLIVDPFRNDRWDYFYMMHKAGELTEQRVVTAIFRGDELLRIEGDVNVGAAASGKPAAAPVETKPAPAPAAAENK
jgi:outer membrane protein assembly factor BamE